MCRWPVSYQGILKLKIHQHTLLMLFAATGCTECTLPEKHDSPCVTWLQITIDSDVKLH